MNYFKNLCKRLLYVAVTILNWIIYIPTTIAFFIIEFCGIVFITPILWVLIGSKKLETLFYKIFNHSNRELWLREYGDDLNNFTSLCPLWGPYVQKYYLSKLIEDETNI